jgi:hypothetical protein
MKAAMRKRYTLVNAELDRARKNAASGCNGISGLVDLDKAEFAAGQLIFDMVLSEEGSDQELKRLVSRRVLYQTIIATFNHQSAIMSRINQERSRVGIRARIKLLYDWLDQNIGRYPKRLEDCAEDAVAQIPGLKMTAGTVKRHITQYRKEKQLAGRKAENKSIKKRK